MLPPVALLLGANVPASDPARALIMVSFMASGALIHRWWAPVPSVLAMAAVSLAEEANSWGFGPGTRFGTAIEIHSGGEFSWPFFAFMTAVALALSLIGVGLRALAPRLRRLARWS